MKAENQVCTLEQAKKLKSLGVAQASIFRHASESDGEGGWIDVIRTAPPKENNNFHFAAFNVAELGVMLPDYTTRLGNLEIGKCETDHITLERYKKGWWNVSYWTWATKLTRQQDVYLSQESNHLHQKETEAEARAAMLIYLLEENYITVYEVNTRLQSA